MPLPFHAALNRLAGRRRAARPAPSRNAGGAVAPTAEDLALIERLRTERLTSMPADALAALAAWVRTTEARQVAGRLVIAGVELGGSTVLVARTRHPARELLLHDSCGHDPASDRLKRAVQANLARHGIGAEDVSVRLVRGRVQDVLHVGQPLALGLVDFADEHAVACSLDRLGTDLSPGGCLLVACHRDEGGARAAVQAFLAARAGTWVAEPGRSLLCLRHAPGAESG